MKRRDFLKGSSAAALTAGVPLLNAHSDGDGDRNARTFNPDQWSVIETVQDHLLPSEPESPGAPDVHAATYLDLTLSDPKFDPEIRDFILKGIGWLDEIARDQKDNPFPLLEPAVREDLLLQIARTDAGERWLSTLISYTLEALLADPLYGGNPDGVGWKWLEHDPGKPRPKPDKIYGRLGRT
jgi:gluconate 2-dehydrogenase gamma chain